MATRRTAMHCNLRVMCKINNLQEVEAEYINKERRAERWKRWKERGNGVGRLVLWLSECRFMNIVSSYTHNTKQLYCLFFGAWHVCCVFEARLPIIIINELIKQWPKSRTGLHYRRQPHPA